ncbi:MAG TPA: hypothetical protein VLG16_02860 [Candidatus Saccharimonadales bacterium]|jgi:magnesium-transporting ATPase (P-type)|nr:hypothetical protein [Candidatus Saccharimonadales bacterium]
MLKELILFIKYPYTAGVIATIWLASAVLMALNSKLNVTNIMVINMLVSVLIAIIGFGSKED